MSLLIQNGTVVTPQGRLQRDVRCEDGRISWIGEWGATRVSSDKVVDASELMVLPGIIDPHVHSRDPGLTQKEDFEHLSRSAIAGGVTTVLEMPNTIPAILNSDVVDDRIDYLEAKSFCDFGLWGMVTGSETESDLRDLKEAGVVGAKLFWGYSLDRTTGSLIYGDAPKEADVIPPASNGELWRLLQMAERVGLLIGVHCEDISIAKAAGSENPPGRSAVEDLQASRPIVSEAVAVATLIELARDTRARVHVLHASTGRAVKLVSAARLEGVKITAETCPHYLSAGLHSSVAIDLDNKVYPPLRGGDEALSLWQAVRDGDIQSIGSDHAPHSRNDYRIPFADRPAGVPGTQTLLPVALTHVSEGRITLEQMVNLLSESTARLYGLYPKKGTIRVGADADLVTVDLNSETAITGELLFTKSNQSPWSGRIAHGRVVTTVLRGEVVNQEGVLASRVSGKFVSSNFDMPKLLGDDV